MVTLDSGFTATIYPQNIKEEGIGDSMVLYLLHSGEPKERWKGSTVGEEGMERRWPQWKLGRYGERGMSSALISAH